MSYDDPQDTEQRARIFKGTEILRVRFTIEGDPQAKARARAAPGLDQGRAFALTFLDQALRLVYNPGKVRRAIHGAIASLRGSHGSARMVKPAKTRQYEKRVAACFEAALLERHTSLYHDWTPHRGPVLLYFVATFPIPPSWPKWRQEAARAGLWKMGAPPDKDNIEKAIADGLGGLAMHKDSQIIGGEQAKRYGDRPGVDVEIVFLDQPTYHEWKALAQDRASAYEGERRGPCQGG